MSRNSTNTECPAHALVRPQRLARTQLQPKFLSVSDPHDTDDCAILASMVRVREDWGAKTHSSRHRLTSLCTTAPCLIGPVHPGDGLSEERYANARRRGLAGGTSRLPRSREERGALEGASRNHVAPPRTPLARPPLPRNSRTRQVVAARAELDSCCMAFYKMRSAICCIH